MAIKHSIGKMIFFTGVTIMSRLPIDFMRSHMNREREKHTMYYYNWCRYEKNNRLFRYLCNHLHLGPLSQLPVLNRGNSADYRLSWAKKLWKRRRTGVFLYLLHLLSSWWNEKMPPQRYWNILYYEERVKYQPWWLLRTL